MILIYSRSILDLFLIYSQLYSQFILDSILDLDYF